MNKKLNILLADDDSDDRFFFNKVLEGIDVPTTLVMIENGEKLMDFLSKNLDNLPNVLFLDLNMPRKNGSECLAEIKTNEKLKDLPVIIYSTSMHEDVADVLYNGGAYYYVRKSNIKELKRALLFIFDLIAEKKFKRPARENFVLSLIKVQ